MRSLKQDEAHRLGGTVGNGVAERLETMGQAVAQTDKVADLSMEGGAWGKGEVSLRVVEDEKVERILEACDHGLVLRALHDAPKPLVSLSGVGGGGGGVSPRVEGHGEYFFGSLWFERGYVRVCLSV